jgi:manganese/zinc/iron transport system permease protein
MVYFTPAGRQRGAEIVRNHRLWELYLTNSANIAPDHVHDDAENIEHVLGEDVVRELERRLGYATRDPHGKAIPSAQEIHQSGGLSGEAGRKARP